MVYERFLNVQASKQRSKNWQLVGRGPLAAVQHGTTGTMVNLVLPEISSSHQLLIYIHCFSLVMHANSESRVFGI